MQPNRTYLRPNYAKFAKVFALFAFIACITVQFWFPLLGCGSIGVDLIGRKSITSLDSSAKNRSKTTVTGGKHKPPKMGRLDSIERKSRPTKLLPPAFNVKDVQPATHESRDKKGNRASSVSPPVHKKNVSKLLKFKRNYDNGGIDKPKNNIGIRNVGFGFSLNPK